MSGKIDILTRGRFDLRLKDGGITSLKYIHDVYDTDYIGQDRRFGDFFVTYRKPDGDWISINTLMLAEKGLIETCTSGCGSKYSVSFPSDEGEPPDILVKISYELDDKSMFYTISILNNSDHMVEIGDIAIPFPMNSSFEWGKKPTESVFRHSFVSGNNSYMFWMRCNSVGPYLTMTPMGSTKLEYYDMCEEDETKPGKHQYRAYIHSSAQGQVAKQKGCNWRQDNTSITLVPKGTEGDSVSYPFKFQWASDYDDVRRIIVDEGLIDVQVIPGMTVPNDLFAKFYLRTNESIKSVIPEFPKETELSYIGKKGRDLHLYKVKFTKLGENLITVKYGDRKSMVLEFFSTEPVETLINKRAAFIAKCQHRDPSKWYNGLISEWNMESQTLLGPDNYDRIKGWRIYEVSCDDPGLSKPAFLAAKNVEYPNQKEVEALDYYIEHFVWGGLQRMDEEEYAYGIYGIPDWKVLRFSEDDGPNGKLHIWRIYDYPHIMLLYYSMYRIAKNHPDICMVLQKEVYLERAYRTAITMFTIPVETGDWSAYKTGLYNELVIEDVINEMAAIGWKERSLRLEGHWKKKVSSFIIEKPNLFGSEYPFDSTGFESTHALAKYALKHSEMSVNEKTNRHAAPVMTYSDAVKFMEAQMEANLFCRGWLEPAYYLYGSDFRASGNAEFTLSYMSQMGGWALLDYALNYSSSPFEYLRLGYASMLSSWALMNSGTPESNYGYWFPGIGNDGGAGGGFEPSPFGYTWLDQEHHRGSWYYSCETDLGYCGALRGASTVLADDPVFGLFCYGGDYKEVVNGFEVTMKDGVRRRFHALLGGRKIYLHMDTDHISATRPIFVKEDFSEMHFEIESSTAVDHTVTLTISGLPEGLYEIYADNTKALSIKGGEEAVVPVAVKQQGVMIRIKKE